MIRLKSLSLQDIKNVEKGTVVFSALPSGGSVTGIYGQNGSGKTAVITVVRCLRCLMAGWSVPDECIVGLVRQGSESASISAVFSVGDDEVGYSVRLKPIENGKAHVGQETVELRSPGERKRVLLDHKVSEEDEMGLLVSTLSPVSQWNSLKSVRRADEKFRQEETLAWSQGRSFVFATSFFDALKVIDEEISDTSNLPKAKRDARDTNLRPLISVLSALSNYARENMRIMTTREGAAVSFGCVPIAHGSRFDVLNITQPVIVPQDLQPVIEQMVEQSNEVLPTVIPGLQLGCDMQDDVTDDRQPGVRVFLRSERNGVAIPFWAESEGVKRIVGMMSLLIRMFNESDVCIAIDEIDSGIFEILLGTLLQVIAEYGRGQLIFTAHNLRVLEVLSDKSIVFSTSNPKNRFTTIKGVRDSNNLRNMYIRAVNIDDQPEELAPRVRKSRVAVAFNKAGRVMRKDDHA